MSVNTERFDENTYFPKAMSLEEIDEFKLASVCAVRRALKAGFDVSKSYSSFRLTELR